MKHLRDAIEKASHDTAAYVTADLRHSARESGWDEEVVSNLRVHHGEDGYNVMVPDDLKDRAFVHEFGDEKTPPSAAIRKYSNNHSVAAQVMLKNIEKHLGGRL
jgi:hypothetical protein